MGKTGSGSVFDNLPVTRLNKVRGSHLEFVDKYGKYDLNKERDTNFYEKGSLVFQVSDF